MVLADKYRYYLSEVRKAKMANGLQVDRVIYLFHQRHGKEGYQDTGSGSFR